MNRSLSPGIIFGFTVDERSGIADTIACAGLGVGSRGTLVYSMIFVLEQNDLAWLPDRVNSLRGEQYEEPMLFRKNVVE